MNDRVRQYQFYLVKSLLVQPGCFLAAGGVHSQLDSVDPTSNENESIFYVGRLGCTFFISVFDRMGILPKCFMLVCPLLCSSYRGTVFLLGHFLC